MHHGADQPESPSYNYFSSNYMTCADAAVAYYRPQCAFGSVSNHKVALQCRESCRMDDLKGHTRSIEPFTISFDDRGAKMASDVHFCHASFLRPLKPLRPNDL